MLYSKQTPAAGGTAFSQFDAAWAYNGDGYIYNDTGTSLDVRIGAAGNVQTLAAGGTLPIKLVYSLAELYVRRTDQSTTQVTVEAQVGTGSAGGGTSAEVGVIAAAVAGHNDDPAAHGAGYRFNQLLASRQPFTAVALGDATTSGNTTYQYLQSATSWFWQLSIRWNGRMKGLRNSGLNGNTAAQMAARFTADVASYSPQVVFVMTGKEDAASIGAKTIPQLVDQVMTSEVSIIRQALAAGIIPVLVAANPIDGQNPAVIAGVNAAKRTLCSELGLTYLDTWSAVANQATGNFAMGMSSDGVLVTEAGAKAQADYIIAQFPNLLTPATPFLPQSTVDLGNYSPNPLLQRVTNSANAAGLPDGWWDQITGQATYSLMPTSVGNKLVITKTDPVSNVYPTHNTIVCPAPGTRVAVSFRLKVTPTSADFNPSCFLGCFGGVYGPLTILNGATGDNDGVVYFEGVIPNGTTSVGFMVHITAGTGSVEISQFAVYQVSRALATTGTGRTMTFASIGDSLTAENGGLTWVNIGAAALGARIRYRSDRNFAVAGKTSSEIRAEQLPLALATDSKFVTLMCGTNNLLAVDTIIADIRAMVAAIIGNGQVPILATIPASDGLPAENLAAWAKLNAAVRNLWRTESGVIGVDIAAAVLAAPTAYNAAPAWNPAWVLPGGVHPNPLGIWTMGAALADAFAGRDIGVVPGVSSYLDVDDISGGIANPLQIGTGGTKTNGTGNVSDRWTTDGSDAATSPATVFTKIARTDGVLGEWQGCTPSSGGADNALRLRARNASGSDITWVAGNTYWIYIEIEYAAAGLSTLIGGGQSAPVFGVYDGTPTLIHTLNAHVPVAALQGRKVVYAYRLPISAGASTTNWSFKVFCAPYLVANGIRVGRVWREIE